MCTNGRQSNPHLFLFFLFSLFLIIWPFTRLAFSSKIPAKAPTRRMYLNLEQQNKTSRNETKQNKTKHASLTVSFYCGLLAVRFNSSLLAVSFYSGLLAVSFYCSLLAVSFHSGLLAVSFSLLIRVVLYIFV